MKVGLLLPANIWFCPFVRIYTNLFDKWGIKYDIIFWNRDGSAESEGISFNKISRGGRITRLIDYLHFSFFLKKTIKRNKYDKLIVFTSQVGLFLTKFLKRRYDRNYIFDFRDLSIEQQRIFRKKLCDLLNSSYANVISSPGFKKYLPPNHYYISHNFDINQVIASISKSENTLADGKIDVLTIGGIRDYESNVQIIDSLINQNGITLRFVGKGPAKVRLEQYSKEKGATNISFEGFYKKEDEPKYIKSATFLNIFYPDLISHKSALSNRFYNSLIYRRPMIVTKGQIQGDFVENYNLGVAVEDTHQIPQVLKNWLSNLDFVKYDKSCQELLMIFLEDYKKFEQMLHAFLEVHA